MQEAILDFCARYYEPQLTKSVYEMRSLEEMVSLKTYMEFMDFGQDGFQRNKLELPSGLRNIGNTCYFNAFMQLLYHINSIRDLFLQAQPSTELVNSLKELFAQMLFSALRYSDPTKVFNELKRGGMKVGEQYDFHQYLSITLDTLEKCLASQKGHDGMAQDRYIHRIFFGKMNQYFNDGDSLKRSVVKFGVITLDAKLERLEKAFQAFRSYEIDGYKSEKGESRTATIRSEITQFPAILTFFINRVDLKEGRLVKNNVEFSYPTTLHLDTDTQIKDKLSQQQQEIDRKIKKVEEQIRSQQHKKTLGTLTNTFEFLSKQQEFEDLEAENNDSFGVFGTDQSHKQTKARLQYYISKLKDQDQYLESRILELQTLKKNILNKSTSFHYSIFALMIHQGTANSGHYFILIRNQRLNKWHKFSDRNVTEVSDQQVDIIASGKKHKSTNVCCVFYKQREFVCDPSVKPIVQASIKAEVHDHDNQMMIKIKLAKINTMMRGYSQVAYEIVNELSRHSVNYMDYFSEEKYYCLANSLRKPAEFATFKELVSEPGFSQQVKEIDSIGGNESDFQMPDIRIESINSKYYKVRNVIKTALWSDSQPEGIVDSLSLLGGVTVDAQMQKHFDRILSIVVLKACYYLDLKINKNQGYEQMLGVILYIVNKNLKSKVVRTQALDNIQFSLNSIGKKMSSYSSAKSLPNQKQEAWRVPFVDIKETLNRRFKIWVDFEDSLQSSSSSIPQEKRTSLEAIEMVKDLS